MTDFVPESKPLKTILCDPNSNGNLENLLDVVAALVWDCNFQSAKNSKAIQSFVQRFSELANVIHAQRTKYSDFELVKVIGQGGFGRVQLVRHKDTRRVYAMKVMCKQHLLDHSQSGYWEERDIMVKASSEWLVTCHQAFVDKENIYLCMDYMPGGDLYYWLEYYDTFTEEQAQFYLAETVLALEALHRLGYIHRDLKPDNMLLDAQGHLKLADFGSCVRLDSQGRYHCSSPIGTPDYISPEMLNCQSKPGYIGPSCDWWALGVIAFEMLFGETAFYGRSLVETYSRILAYEKSLNIPNDTEITPNFESLIRAFLKGPDTRLGAHGDAEEVKHHPFFEGVNWENFRSATPPIRPVVTSDVDTSNIDFDESELLSAENKFAGNSSTSSSGSPANLPRTAGAFATKKPPGPPAYFTGDNLAFAGFTFDRDEVETVERVAKAAAATTMANGDSCCADMEAALAEARSKLNAAEKQSALDKIAVHEAQRRLEDTKTELESVKSELGRMIEENKLEIDTIQNERDILTEKIRKLQAELNGTLDELESERKCLASVRDELNSVKLTLHSLPSSVVVNEANEQSATGRGSPSLEIALEEARQQACRAEAELSSSRRLHAEEMGDLSDQLHAEKTFSQLYKSKLAEAEAEMESLRTSLNSVQQLYKDLKEKNFVLESNLAKFQVELDGMKKTYDTDLRESTSSVAKLKERVMNQANDISRITEQRDDLMKHCKTLEDSVNNLNDELQTLRKENKIQKLKIDQTVSKLYEVATVAPVISNKGKKSTEAAKVASLEKQLRTAEHKHQKEVEDLNSTLSRLKTDNEEKARAMAELTQTNRHLEQELEKLHAQINTLSECYGTKASSGNARNANNRNSMMNTSITWEQCNRREVGGVTCSHSLENLRSISASTQSIEGVCDFPLKVKGKKKLAWTPKFVVIQPYKISFFSSKVQRDQIDSLPCEEIPIQRASWSLFCRLLVVVPGWNSSTPCRLQKIFMVRPGTALDLTYASEDDASRLICIISDEMIPDSNAHDADHVSHHSVGGNVNAMSHLSWQGHSFQPMTFRMTSTLCEVCRRPCSDLRSPPPALECINCRLRIHRNHVENHEKFVVCPNTVKQWIIRAPSPAERNAWISYIDKLQKEASEGLHSPMGRNVQPSTPVTGSVGSSSRYRSLRNCGGLKYGEFAARRSVASVAFPRYNSSSVVGGSSTAGSVVPTSPSPTVSSTSQTNSTDDQHDL